jgi:phosphatidylinositol glycan class W
LILIAKLLRAKSNQSLLFDYMLLIFPVLCSFTIGADYNHITFAISLVIGCSLLYRRLSSRAPADNDKLTNTSTPFQNTYYITLFKGKVERFIFLIPLFTFNVGSIVLLTCIAILAIDFPVFPRRHGKTETFGLSLMDTGVGLFIVSSAVTSKYARTTFSTHSTLLQGQCLPKHQVKHESNPSKDSPKPSNHTWSVSYALRWFSQLLYQCSQQLYLHSMKHSIVLGLGIGRVIVLEALQYQKHVSEYGYHWNFFVTLFVVWTISDLFHTFTACVDVSMSPTNSSDGLMRKYTSSRSLLLVIGVIILVLYQWFLSIWKGSEWLLDNTNRDTNLLTMNKEGICSLGGYIPLYLFTECISSWCFFSCGPQTNPSSTYINTTNIGTNTPQSTHSSNNSPTTTSTVTTPASSQSRKELVFRLIGLVIIFYTLWIGCDSYLQPTSRRLCNLAYVLCILFIAMLILLCMYCVDYCTSAEMIGIGCAPLKSISQMNTHSLYLFLLANVMTGMVNMSMKTLYASTGAAMGILAMYTFLLTVFAWYMQDLLSMGWWKGWLVRTR